MKHDERSKLCNHREVRSLLRLLSRVRGELLNSNLIPRTKFSQNSARWLLDNNNPKKTHRQDKEGASIPIKILACISIRSPSVTLVRVNDQRQWDFPGRTKANQQLGEWNKRLLTARRLESCSNVAWILSLLAHFCQFFPSLCLWLRATPSLALVFVSTRSKGTKEWFFNAKTRTFFCNSLASASERFEQQKSFVCFNLREEYVSAWVI